MNHRSFISYPPVRWASAIVFVLCATGLGLLADPWAGAPSPYALYLFAFAAVAYFAGPLPAVGAVASSVIAVASFFIDPRTHGLPHEVVGVSIFVLTGLAIIVLVTRMKRGRQIAEEARASLEWERNVLHSVMDGAKNFYLVCLDRDFNFVRVNETYARTCGCRPEEMIGKNHFALYPHAENEEIFRRVRDTGEPAEFKDKPFEFPDQPERGVTYWDWTLSPVKNAAGQVEMLIFALSETTARKRAENALRRSEEEFRSLFELSAVGAGQADPATGRLLRVNHRLCELTGYPEEKLLTMRFSDFTHPDDREREMSLMGPLLRGEVDRCEVEKRYVRMDGKVVWVHASVRLIRDERGKPARTMAGIIDIDERKRHGARIEKLSRLYAVLSQANEIIVRTRDETHLYQEICRIISGTGAFPLVWIGEVRDGDIVPIAWSGRGAGYLGKIDVTVTGEHGRGPTGTSVRENRASLNRDFVSNENTAPWRTPALQYGFRTSAAFPLRKGGRPIAALTLYADVADAFDDEQLRLIESLCADLSYALDALDLERSRTEAEQALRKSEARYRSLFTAMSEGFALHELIYDEQGNPCDYRFLEVNPAFENATGLRASEVVGRTLKEMLPNTEPIWIQRYGQVVLTGEPAHFEEYHGPTGNWYEVFASRAGPRQFVVIFLNTSERKRAEDSLQKVMADLRETDRRKDEFLAMLAHELRNPMATISAASTLLGRMELPAQAVKSRDAMERQVRHLARLIDDLLDISRITRGKIALDKETLDLREPLERAIEVTRPAILEAAQKLTLEVSHTPLYASGDALRLQQIFTNLLTNAARYSDRGGEISVSLWGAGPLAILKVKDTGVGIDKSMQEKIFEPFMQIDPGLHRSKGGLGIGLTVVKSLTELHGGSVSVFSEGAGKGTTFTISLPLQEVRPAAVEREIAGMAGGLTILIVEDNRDTAVLTAALLEELGHKALVAYDGESGLELALRHIPDVALLDIGLPGLDGYQVARGIRSAGLGSMLVLAVSGYGQEQDRLKSREAGFDAHFLKPLEYDALAPVFAEWRASPRSGDIRALRTERSPEHWQ